MNPSHCVESRVALAKRESTNKMEASSEAEEVVMVTPIPDSTPAPQQILGIEGSTVLVLIHSKELILKCLTEKLMGQRMVDPKYRWTGPIGLITQESQRFILTDEGNLEFFNIHGSDSGNYICTIAYARGDRHITTEIHFLVYVYHTPGKSINLSTEFETDTCENNVIASFEKRLLKNLEALVHDLHCEIREWNSQCHSASDAMSLLTHRLTFMFVVFPFALAYEDFCENSDCSNSTNYIKKAYATIEKSLEDRALDSVGGPKISYVLGSLTGTKVDHCKPGFGKNTQANVSRVCPGCCVACPPGSYSARLETTCTLCAAGSYNKNYGQTSCKPCPGEQSSDRRGSQAEKECHRTLPIWAVILISFLGTGLILAASWIMVPKCRGRKSIPRNVEETGSELKSRRKTLARVANAAAIQEQRNRLKEPPGRYKRNRSLKRSANSLAEESVGLLSHGKEETSPGPGSSPDLEPRLWQGPRKSFEEANPLGKISRSVSKGTTNPGHGIPGGPRDPRGRHGRPGP
ncbi:zona pellucida-binding protein 2-like [Ornithorhynchus anatinus]|nr:zona pellucida-binding protein 2-like [Ornithorhynchus anatinus]